MSTVDLKELVEFAAEIATTEITGRKAPMTAFCVLVGATGERTIVELMFRNRYEKITVFAGLRQLMRESGTIAYAVIAEAWAAPEPPDGACGDAIVRPSDHPDRWEMVVAVASDGFNSHARHWKIRRDYKGAVAALDECADQPTNPVGQWLNLLGRRA